MTRDEAIDAWAAMTAEERLAMAETAPRVAEAWEGGPRMAPVRRCPMGHPEYTLAYVHYERWSNGWVDEFGTNDVDTTREAAQERADLRLKQEGWILK